MEPLIFAYQPKLAPRYLVILMGVVGGAAVEYSLLYRIVGFIPFPVANILMGIAGVVMLWYTKRMVVYAYLWRKEHTTVVLDEQGISFASVHGSRTRRVTQQYSCISRIRRVTETYGRHRRRTGETVLSVQFNDGTSEQFRSLYFDSAAAFHRFAKQLRQQVAEARDGVV